jgi:cell division protein FtsB
VLALVVCALALALAYPLREFIAQRREIADLRSQTAAQQQRVDDLQTQKDRWQDPAYVKAMAAQRLHFVMPGETGYVVLEPDEAPAPKSATPGAAPSPPTQAADRPWFSDIWRSVQVADRPAQRSTPAPTPSG